MPSVHNSLHFHCSAFFDPTGILGHGLILGNLQLLEYGGVVWILFHWFVLIFEEPIVRATFGSEYTAFCAEVPRWIPRFTSWTGHPSV